MYGMEKAMATHSSTLAWKIPWMEEPGSLQSMGSLRVRHKVTFTLWDIQGEIFNGWINRWVREGNRTPLQYSCLENPMDGGAW